MIRQAKISTRIRGKLSLSFPCLINILLYISNCYQNFVSLYFEVREFSSYSRGDFRLSYQFTFFCVIFLPTSLRSLCSNVIQDLRPPRLQVQVVTMLLLFYTALRPLKIHRTLRSNHNYTCFIKIEIQHYYTYCRGFMVRLLKVTGKSDLIKM